MLFEVAVGKPGPIGQAVHLFLDEEAVPGVVNFRKFDSDSSRDTLGHSIFRHSVRDFMVNDGDWLRFDQKTENAAKNSR